MRIKGDMNFLVNNLIVVNMGSMGKNVIRKFLIIVTKTMQFVKNI